MDLDEAYRVLEVHRTDATAESVRSSYKRLALRHHPDKNPGNEELAKANFQRVSSAYRAVAADLEGRSTSFSSTAPTSSSSSSWDDAKEVFRETFGVNFEDAAEMAMEGLVSAASAVLSESARRASAGLSDQERLVRSLRSRVESETRTLEDARRDRRVAERSLQDFLRDPRRNVPGVDVDLESALGESSLAKEELSRARRAHAEILVPALTRTVATFTAMLCSYRVCSYYGLFQWTTFLPTVAFFVLLFLLPRMNEFGVWWTSFLRSEDRLNRAIDLDRSCAEQTDRARLDIEVILRLRIEDATETVRLREGDLSETRRDLSEATSPLNVGLSVFGAVLGVQLQHRRRSSEVIHG